MTTSPFHFGVKGAEGGGGRGGTKREEGPPDRRLFRYWFEHRRSWNIVKLLLMAYFVGCK